MSKKNEKFDYRFIMHIAAAVGYGLLFFYLIANILFSQLISPLYFELLRNNDSAMTEFLKQSRTASYFQLLSPEIRTLFSVKEKEVYADENNRRALIEKLELLRQENPKSRDILYSLHLLYEKSGNEIKAEEYLRLAQEIDPGVLN